MLRILFVVFMIGIWAYRLRIDFRRDRGSHKGTKVLGIGIQLLWWGSATASIIAPLLFFGLGSRSQKALSASYFGFPFIGLIAGAAFNHGLFEGTPASSAGWTVYSLVLAVLLGLYALPVIFYRRKKVTEFFALGPLTKEHVQTALSPH